MKHICCDLCGSSDHKILFEQTDIFYKTTKERFKFVKCKDCGLYFINPRPSIEEMDQFYPQGYSFHLVKKEAWHKLFIKSIISFLVDGSYHKERKKLSNIFAGFVVFFLTRIKFIREKLIQFTTPKPNPFIDLKKPSTILDVGCGAGLNTHIFAEEFSLKSLLKRNWQVYGIEPSEARRIARQNGINNIYSDLFKAHFEGNFFDVIRFNWSFEHIHNPTQTILECRRILKKDGRLIMFLPNYNGITYKIFPQCVEIPVHLYYWTTDTFLRLCKKTNFEVVDYYTFSYPLLFLFACELMGRNDICSYFKKDFKRFSSLKTFLDLAGQENMGDDMGFTLKKNSRIILKNEKEGSDMSFSDIPVVVLCGGRGTRLKEETDIKPKPMVEIGAMPILWHIMKTYAHYSFNNFILCLGYKGQVIKEYFYHYEMLANDFTIELGSENITVHPKHSEKGWKVTLVDTGRNAMTGARVKRIDKFIDTDVFMLTYGDGVTDLNIKELLNFHKSHGKIGTVTGVFPPSQYGEFLIQGDRVLSFNEKPKNYTNSINGGYFVFDRKFFEYLEDDDNCILERQPLQKLANDGQLKVFVHQGFWQCMDTYRDYKYLSELWANQEAPWNVWDSSNK